MSNLSTAYKTEEIATSGILRESEPLQSAAPEVLESSSEEEGETREDAGHGKRRHSPEEQSDAKRIKGPGPDAFSFSDIRRIHGRLNCMIGVNDENPFGTFTTITEGWMIKLSIDVGYLGSPSIALHFIKNKGKDICRSSWNVDSYVRQKWAIDNMTFSRLYDQDPLSLDKSDDLALMACATEKRPRLSSMKFRSWNRVIGFNTLTRKEQKQMPKNLRRLIKAIFKPDDSYTLTIWFQAPYDVVSFQRNCLELFTRALAARRPPLYNFVDDAGDIFTMSRKRGPKEDFASTKGQMILASKRSAAPDSREKGKTGSSVTSTEDETEVEPTKQSSDFRLQAPQPTSESRPGLTGESPSYESDMGIRRQRENPTHPQPLQTEAQRASVDEGSNEAPVRSRTPKDISPNRPMGSDMDLRRGVPLDLEREDLIVMDQSATPLGINPRPDSAPDSNTSPNNRTPP